MQNRIKDGKLVIGNGAKIVDRELINSITAGLDPDDFNSIEILDGVKEIGYMAFGECSNLTNITIPPSVKKIDTYAFYLCSSLTTITIPDGVTIIGERTFNGCSSLTTITIPPGVKKIGMEAFRGCSGLTTITIPPSVKEIGNYAFYRCSDLTSITIPPSVEKIGHRAFSECSSLITITIPFSIEKIGVNAFYGCTSLVKISVPYGLDLEQHENLHLPDDIPIERRGLILALCHGYELGLNKLIKSESYDVYYYKTFAKFMMLIFKKIQKQGAIVEENKEGLSSLPVELWYKVLDLACYTVIEPVTAENLTKLPIMEFPDDAWLELQEKTENGKVMFANYLEIPS